MTGYYKRFARFYSPAFDHLRGPADFSTESMTLGMHLQNAEVIVTPLEFHTPRFQKWLKVLDTRACYAPTDPTITIVIRRSES